jgi:uncharacterized protein YuzE
MKIEYDREVDALYIHLQDKYDIIIKKRSGLWLIKLQRQL